MKKVPVFLALVLLCAASAFGDCSTLTNITEVVPLEPVESVMSCDSPDRPAQAEE